MGSEGHGVVPVLNQALQEWVETTGKPVFYVMKGMNNRSEMYSALEAEVEDPEDVNTSLNEVRATTYLMTTFSSSLVLMSMSFDIFESAKCVSMLAFFFLAPWVVFQTYVAK